LDFWVDKEIQPGDEWFGRIKTALDSSTIAVLLVSSKFLASQFIPEHELPQIVTAVKRGSVRLLWVYLSPAAYDATALRDLQAAHDLSKPQTKHLCSSISSTRRTTSPGFRPESGLRPTA
jgi:hypothetical protein